jgi:hypothetical protein
MPPGVCTFGACYSKGFESSSNPSVLSDRAICPVAAFETVRFALALTVQPRREDGFENHRDTLTAPFDATPEGRGLPR